jgi:GGDEF domain-containing protein
VTETPAARSILSLEMRRLHLTLRHALLACACGSAVAIYGAFLLYERPGLGIGHFYYVSILLAALATGPFLGAAAGATATLLYATGVLLNPAIASSEVLSASTTIRFVTYVAVGAVTGYFAKSSRQATAELRVLADRDAVTGLPNTRAFERAIGKRLETQLPFVLLVAGVESQTATAEASLNSVAERLILALEPEDEVARIGHHEFAVLSPLNRPDGARRLAAHLQRALASSPVEVTFGWATFPQDGDNALSLYRAADERLYARRVITRNEDATVVSLERGVATAP